MEAPVKALLKVSGNPFFVIIIAIFAWLVITMETPYGVATTPDSISYLDIAANIHNGHGALATDFRLSAGLGKTYVEQRLWPVLYSAVLSVFVDDLSDVYGAAMVAKILFMLTALLMYLILTRYLQTVWALLATLLFCITTPMTTIYTYAWSETLFVPLLLLAALLLICFFDAGEDKPKTKQLIALLIMLDLIALFYTRYIGITFCILVPLMFFFEQKRSIKLILFILSGYCCTVGFGLLSNYRVTGSISGGVRNISDKGLMENLADVFLVLQYMVSSSWKVTVAIIVVLLIPMVASLYLKKGGRLAVISGNVRSIVLVSLFFAAWYLLSIIAFRTYSTFDTLDVRLLSPAFPFIWILLCVVMAYCINKSAKARGGFVFAGFFVLLLSANGYLHLLASLDTWSKYGSPGHFMTSTATYNNFTTPAQKNYLKTVFAEMTATNGVMVSFKPLLFEFMFEKTNFMLPAIVDSALLERINALPAGSILVHEQGRDPFLALRQQYDLKYSSARLGNIVAVKIPVSAVNKVAP